MADWLGGVAGGLDALQQLLVQRKLETLKADTMAEQIRQFNVKASETEREHTLREQERRDALAQAKQYHEDAAAAQKQQREDIQTENFAKLAPPSEDIGRVMAGRLQSLGAGSLVQHVPMSNPNPIAMPAGVLTTSGGAAPALPGGLSAPPPFTPERFPMPQGGFNAQAASAAAADKAALAGEAERQRVANQADRDKIEHQFRMDLATQAQTHQETLAKLKPGTGRIVVQGPEGPMWADPHNPNAAAIPILGPGQQPVGRPITNTTRTMMEGAQMLRPHLQNLTTDAEALAQRGLFGPIMGRVRHVLTTVGSVQGATNETLANALASDPALSTDRLAGRFATELGLLASGLGRVHGGARGGGSIQMIDYLKGLVTDVGTVPLFLGRLEGIDRYLKGYASGPAVPPELPTFGSDTVPTGRPSAAPRRLYYDAQGNPIAR